MPTFFLGLAALVVVLWLASQFRNASPAKLAKATRVAGGVGGLAGALLLTLRGQVTLAALLAGFALWLLGKNRNPFGGIGGFGGLGGFGRRAERRSGVRSAMIEMQLDLDSGAMSGTVLAGRFEGRRLDDLSSAELGELLAECGRVDPEGERLLEAYLDRRFAGGRAAGQGDSDPRGGAAGRAQPGGMTEQEAYEILGLAKGASRDEIARAHRELMKKLHPDAGGSTHLAARVNEAKDVLMRRHH